MKKFLKILLAFSLIAVVITGIAAYDLFRYAHNPAGATNAPVTFEIKRGQSFNAVAEYLNQQGFIANPIKFRVIARYTGHDKTIKFGEYRLSPSMTPIDILEQFSKGNVVLHKVTVPEGFNLADVAARMASRGFCDKETFFALATDPAFADRMQIPADTVEGYLFPDTYHFEKDPAPETIITAMISRFRETFDSKWEVRATELGFTMHDVVTFASIIEKETGIAEERPIVSSVFHNRLKLGMRLASDPTVIYGIQEFDGNLTRKHLKEKTAYNTYMINGLPPGPIANPGLKSIEAALFPADTDYLFFVAKPDRSHHFSRTYTEHSRAVRKYQLGG